MRLGWGVWGADGTMDLVSLGRTTVRPFVQGGAKAVLRERISEVA